MKKRNILGAVLCSVCLVASSAVPAMADAVKVVTLGADLSDAQKQTMLNYFKVNTNEVQIIEITNDDEVAHLSSYVPMEQIGTRTVSCAYVKPTSSGGIKVRTANLNWVTCNMIASTLSTSGVTNCEVVAACPFEVSGTGALTGVIMAYETASGEKLDETKVELATQEMIITADLGEEVGQDEATGVVNEAKMVVLENNVQNADEIYNIVINIADQKNIVLTAEQLDDIVALLTGISSQDYDYDSIRETLENVESNVTGAEVELEGETETGVDEEVDSIIADLDESILGEDVIAGSTEDATVGESVEAEEAEPVEEEWDYEEEAEPVEEEWDYEEEAEPVEEEWNDVEEAEPVVEEMDEEWDYEEEAGLEVEEVDEELEAVDGDELYDLVGELDEELEAYVEKYDTSVLSEDAAYMFEQARLFCEGEFLNDPSVLQQVMPEAFASVALDSETGAKVQDKVLDIYYNILLNGTASYVPSETDIYLSTELNMIDNEMKKLFGIIENDDIEEEDVLETVPMEERTALYNDTMKFFEKLYGEESTIETYEADAEEYAEGYAGDYPEEYSEEYAE